MQAKALAGTDGSRLYINRDMDPQRFAQAAISGGEIAPVPVALPFAEIRDVSPDGSIFSSRPMAARGACGMLRFQQARCVVY
jgi:hypothetical protein